MKIISVNSGKKPFVSFQRKPTPKEFPIYSKSIQEGMKVLKKELGIIIHNSSVPSKAGENFGIGSLLSKSTQSFFAPFLKSHGISSIQQEPNYIRRHSDPSPYDPISTSKNVYMIPLEKLATEEYGHILDKRILNQILKNDNEYVDYYSIQINFSTALTNAYFNFLENSKKGTLPENLIHEFDNFKKEKYEELEPNALYEILNALHNEENWEEFPQQDKNLYLKSETNSRKKELVETYKSQIDFHIFKQWLVEREIQKTNENNKKIGIKIIADNPVAFFPAEVWKNQDLFLKDIALGCPPDYFSKDGQRWGFAVLNPKKIFNKDGSLGEAGIFLQKRFEEAFKASPGGIRIDHVIGLIDPFVYKKSEPKMNEQNSGRLYSSPNKELFKEYLKFTDDEYAAIIEKIVFPAAAKFGIPKENIICEDLGEQTPAVQRVIQKLNLTGLSVTQFGYSGVDAPEKNVIMMGSHDNKSFIEYTDELFNSASNLDGGRDRFMFKTHILASDTSVPKQNVDVYREELRKDKSKFINAAFAELFISPAKKVQVFFTDLFGIGKTYNVPGSKEGCWTLRLKENYEDIYYDNLKKGLAFNIPKAIATAIRRKGEEFSSQNAKLLRKLDYFSHMLER